jgi:HEAT repeat protein
MEAVIEIRDLPAKPSEESAMRWPRVRFTVRWLMAVVAVLGVLLWAWLYRRENASIDRSLTAIQLRAFAEADAAQRRMAIEDLAHSGLDDRVRVLGALAAGMVDGDWRVRLAAARSLGAAGRGWVWSGASGEDIDAAMRSLIGAFDDARAEVQIEALRSLGALYTDRNPFARNPGRRAAGATFEATEHRAVGLLLRRMSDSDPAIRTAAVQAFSRVGSASGAGPDSLVGIMTSDPVKDVRAAASLALPVGWPTLRELYPPLLHHLKQVQSIEERSAIGWAIGGLPAPPVESIPDLIEALALDHFALNKTVPVALAKLGPTARPALPALAGAAARELADPRVPSALEAAQAIVTIDSDSPEAQALLQPMVGMLRGSPMSFMRQQAAVVLAKFGPSAASAVQALRGALNSGPADVRERAAFLLGTIGPAARPALDDLTGMARQDPDSRLRQVAVDAMRRIDVE